MSDERDLPGDNHGHGAAGILRREPYRPGVPWRILVTAAVVYHLFAIFGYHLPGFGVRSAPVKRLVKVLGVHRYTQVTSNRQAWDLFAPNPPSSNTLLRVLVEDREGRTWDLHTDIGSWRTYPNLRYVRRGKINRRLTRSRRYREGFAAWVCRHWEVTHGGQGARRVRLIQASSPIPPPTEVWPLVGFDVEAQPVTEKELDTYPCETLIHGQLPPGLRARYGLPPHGDAEFVPVRPRSKKVRRGKDRTP